MTGGHRQAMRILFVDGDASGADEGATRLERADETFTVETATGVAERFDRLADGAIDCIVFADDLSDPDWTEFLERVRERRPRLPFVLFCEDGAVGDGPASDATPAGVTDCVRRDGGPDQFARLADRVRTAVESSRSECDRGGSDRRGSDRRFDAILDDPERAVAVLDPEGRVRTANRTAMDLLDVERDAVVGERFWAAPWWGGDARSIVRERVERAAGGEYVDFAVEREPGAGEWRHVRGRIRPVAGDDDAVESLIVSVRDVTDRVEAERERREKSELLDSVFEQVPVHMYVKDREARYVRVSEHYIEETDEGPSAAEHVGKTDRELYPGEFGSDAFEDDLRVIETGEPLVDKEEYEPLTGVWNLTTKVPLYGDDGDITGLIGVTRWITERKEYERQLKRQNERLDEFAGIVSHDLRNPLNVAIGRAEMLAEETDSDHVDAVLAALERMETLIEDILTLSRVREPPEDLERVDLEAVSESAWRNVPTTDATLVVDATASVLADRNRLQQLLENLMRNAVEHGNGDATVTVGHRDDGFYVADDGPGIPPDERDEVFETGYSTADDGTGFGLHIVEGIADAFGWEVAVTDSEDGGARFEITGVETADGE